MLQQHVRTKHRPRLHLAADVLVLLFLVGYILLGVRDVPLHGDEATTIWMSKDFDTILLQANPEAVFYEPPPRRTTEQHLRVITMNASKLSMGAAWTATGFSAEDINEQWVWSPDLDINWQRENGHLPSEKLLFVSRLSSALMMVVSVALVLSMARLALGGLFTNTAAVSVGSWIAMTFYALNPAVLVNGRRAMFEGGLLLGLALVGWGVFALMRRYTNVGWRDYSVLGVLTGLALTTKHSAAFTVTILYAGLLVLPLLRGINLRAKLMQRIGGMMLATGLALLTMLALTPLWWATPLAMPETVIEERREILDLQAALFGEYDTIQDRVEGLWRESIKIPPQYYEAPYWGNFAGVAGSIQQYENRALAGLTGDGWDVLRGVLLAWGVVGSLVIIWKQPKTRTMLGLLLLWAAGMILVTLVSVPMAWQRYYLPLQLPLSVLMGLGAAWAVQAGIRFGTR